MTLHPRLQQPTLESPVRRGHSFIMAVALAVMAAGFAYAMPRTMLATADAELQQDEVAFNPTGSTHTSTATTPKPKKTPKDETEEGGTERAENHGVAVSTAAHCDLDGKAHGEFVRSIAHDKDATVAEVEAACAAAQAAAAATDSDDAETKGSRPSKAPKVKPHGGTNDQGGPQQKTSAGPPADDKGPGQSGPPDHAKADKDKP